MVSGRRFVACVVGMLVTASVVQAEIPQMISYQGKVTDGSGNPLPDNTYAMRFRIYDDAAAGTMQWDSGDQSVAVSGGVFSVLFGESPQPALDLPFDADYWLDVDIGGDAQSPRRRMASVGYAYMASGLVPGTEVSGAVTSGTTAAIKGTNTATEGLTYGVSGSHFSTAGAGVYGVASATSGTTYGVYGAAVSPAGFAGYFQGNARVTGDLTVDGTLSGSGMGDITAVIAGTGLTGGATSGDATLNVAVPLALSGSNLSPIVSGTNSGTGGASPGVQGFSASTSGIGVYGRATAGSGYSYGGYFTASSTFGTGVYGVSKLYGVYARADATDGMAVFGNAIAASGTTYGVYGRSVSPSGYGVWFSGGLAGSGTKSCVVRTSQGPSLMYCQESPENWFEDVGRGRLASGFAHIELDPLFLETVTIDDAHPMEVFVQLRDDCRGVFVKAGTSGFDVKELQEGSSSAEFSYRVMAKRKGYETKRLDYCAAAEQDSYLFPELREKELRELEEERAHLMEE